MAMDSDRRDGLGTRMTRALRLDPALYREVAAASGSTRQASVVILITAIASSLSWGVLNLAALLPAESASAFNDSGVVSELANPSIGFNAVAHVCAWLAWTVGLWIVGARLTAPASPALSFWALARAMAFAQTAAVFRLVTVALVEVVRLVLGVEALLSSFMKTLVWSVETGTDVWVLVATFVAVREALGLSHGRTLGSLILVGLTLSGLVGFSAVSLVIASGHDALDPMTLQDLPRNIAEIGGLAVVGLLVLSGSLLHLRWMRVPSTGCTIGALLVPAGVATAVLLGLMTDISSRSTPDALGVVAPRNNVGEFAALAVVGLGVICGSLFIHREWLRLDSGWKLFTAGLVTVVLLGVSATGLALVETTIPEVVGSTRDFPAAPAIAAGFDFNLDLGVGQSGLLVSILSEAVLDAR